MEDLWRLPAQRYRRPDQVKKSFGQGSRDIGAGAARCRQPRDQCRGRSSPGRCAGAGRGSVDAAIARGDDVGALAGVPGHDQGNIDQAGFANTNGLKMQRDLIAKDNSPVVDNLRKAGAVILGRTNCPAFSYRWFTTNLIHGNTKNPRDPGDHAGRLIRRRGSGGRGRHRPHRAWHRYRGLDPLSRLCLRRSWPAADPRPGRGLQCVAAGAPDRAADQRRSRVRWRAPSAICRIALAAMSAKTCAIPGGCRRRSKGPPMPKRAALCVQPRRA